MKIRMKSELEKNMAAVSKLLLHLKDARKDFQCFLNRKDVLFQDSSCSGELVCSLEKEIDKLLEKRKDLLWMSQRG